MKNNFTIIKDKVYIEIFCKDKRLETVIDTDDFGKVDSHEGRWYAWYSKDNNSYYVCGWKTVEGKVKTFYLHRFLYDEPKGMVIDHIDHNTLNNTRTNTRAISKLENHANLKRLGGVHYDNFSKSWRVKFTRMKKRYDLGRFKTEEEATKARDEKMKELLGG